MNFLKNVTKDVVLDQTTYAAIQSARWGPRTAPFWTNTPLVPPWAWKPIVLALGRRYPPAGQNKSCQKKKAPNLNQRRGWLRGIPKGAWEPRGPWAEPALALGNPLTHNQDKNIINVTHKEKPQWPSCCANVVLLPCLVPLLPCH